MDKNIVIKRIKDTGIVAVVRAKSMEEATLIANACLKGGINVIEITFTVPEAEKVIYELSKQFNEEEMLIGAGTVLDKKTCELAINHGAKFIVSPGFDAESAEYCFGKGIPYMPGCMTITEMLTALKHHAEIVKLFPGSAFGPSFVKNVRGPLPNIQIMPTGGVDINNVQEWFKNGVIAVGVGSQLTAPAKNKDYDKITQLAKEFILKIKEVR